MAHIGELAPSAARPAPPAVEPAPPAEIEIGEEVTVSVTVTNASGQSSSYEVTLKVNNTVVDTASITLAAGASQEVTFTTSRDTAGTHTVDINGQTGRFVVKEAGNWWDNIGNWWGNVIDIISSWWDRVFGK